MTLQYISHSIISMDAKIDEVVSASSAKWGAAFNSGDPDGCAAMYETNAVLTAKPFGTFTGREAIRAFWAKLIADGYKEAEYIDRKFAVVPKEQTSGSECAIVSADWKMNKAHGSITRELWVVQSSGGALLRVDEFEFAG